MKEKIFHCFQWEIKGIIQMIKVIKDCGFTAIQITPVQKMKEDVKNPWWMMYQSCGFDNIGNIYGSEDDLKELCTLANDLNIKIIVDIIINHVCGDKDGNLIPYEEVDEILNNKDYFKEPKVINNWQDRYEITNYSMHGLPSLNLENEDLQDIVFEFLNKLVDLGVKGFRIDSCKQIKLPKEGSTFLERLKELKDENGLFIYGEIIFEPEWLIDEYLQYINILTNSYNGKHKDKIVLFFMSHDSENEFGYSKCIGDNDILNKWEELIRKNKESSVIFYPRANRDNIWKNNRIIEINKL